MEELLHLGAEFVVVDDHAAFDGVVLVFADDRLISNASLDVILTWVAHHKNWVSFVTTKSVHSTSVNSIMLSDFVKPYFS